MTLLRCTCGGHAEWVPGGGFIDQFECSKCDFKTHPYWDGADFAERDWNRAQEDKDFRELVRRTLP